MSVLMGIRIIVKILLTQISAGCISHQVKINSRSPYRTDDHDAYHPSYDGYVNVGDADYDSCGFLFSIARHNIYI